MSTEALTAGPKPVFDLAGKRVWVAGHKGMVGQALVRRLASERCELVTADRRQVDLTRQAETEAFLERVRPDAIFIAAAKVGGILANSTRPAEFIYDNLMIQTNIIAAAHRFGVQKVLILGSSCIYPKMAPQPMTEDALLTGPLEPTNEWYAIAKIAGVKLGQAYRQQFGGDFISAMPTNLYGEGDNFDLNSSHVLPALMMKAHNAKRANAESLTIWGTGSPTREFLHADDCADALVFLMKHYSGSEHVNVGSGQEISILDLARTICEVVGFQGRLDFDTSKPDGTPRKLMSSERLANLGWRAKIGLREGVARTYGWLLAHSGAA